MRNDKEGRKEEPVLGSLAPRWDALKTSKQIRSESRRWGALGEKTKRSCLSTQRLTPRDNHKTHKGTCSHLFLCRLFGHCCLQPHDTTHRHHRDHQRETKGNDISIKNKRGWRRFFSWCREPSRSRDHACPLTKHPSRSSSGWSHTTDLR